MQHLLTAPPRQGAGAARHRQKDNALVLNVAPVLLASVRALLALDLSEGAWAAADRVLSAMDAGAASGRFGDVLHGDEASSGLEELRTAALAAFGGAAF